ncbi:MAG: hypothetical protein IT364_09350, partial [Candidatus Hydrogenedentes bacterium]|nr:hypothetical protein [Candidatus Hydrogenedentota bacterium]
VKRFIVGLSTVALLLPCMLILGCGGDKTVEDREANYNQSMEDSMRNSSTVQQKREELAEDEAMIDQSENGGDQGEQEDEGEQ